MVAQHWGGCCELLLAQFQNIWCTLPWCSSRLCNMFDNGEKRNTADAAERSERCGQGHSLKLLGNSSHGCCIRFRCEKNKVDEFKGKTKLLSEL